MLGIAASVYNCLYVLKITMTTMRIEIEFPNCITKMGPSLY